jgi:small subunit ribosomal protein S4
MNTQRRRKVSEFGIQLREKQKVRKSYSVLEKQFRNYFEKAEQRKGMTGENLLRMLEMRLDNVVFRMGLARSRAEARQLVTHGHFTVNGRPTNIPSFGTKVGDRIEVRESRRGREYFKGASEQVKAAQVPEWVSVDAAKLSGTILLEPAREQMPMEFNEQLVVEFYSR